MKNADVAELADALDLGSSGRPWGFKSSHPHQISKQFLEKCIDRIIILEYNYFIV